MLCNTKHVKTMYLTTFWLCFILPSETLNLLARISNAFSSTIMPFGAPVLCYSLFPCELSSAVGFYKPWHQGKGVVTKQEIVQIWSCLPQEFRGRNPGVLSSIFFLNLLWLNICTSDIDPLDPTSTQRNLYSALTKAISAREKKTL